MLSNTKILALAAPLTGLLLSLSVTASPYAKGIDLSGFSAQKRQDDPSGVGPEDDDPNDINIDNTGPLRSGKQSHILSISHVLGETDLLVYSCRCPENVHRPSHRNMVPG